MSSLEIIIEDLEVKILNCYATGYKGENARDLDSEIAVRINVEVHVEPQNEDGNFDTGSFRVTEAVVAINDTEFVPIERAMLETDINTNRIVAALKRHIETHYESRIIEHWQCDEETRREEREIL